jgi:hypothetical protein
MLVLGMNDSQMHVTLSEAHSAENHRGLAQQFAQLGSTGHKLEESLVLALSK